MDFSFRYLYFTFLITTQKLHPSDTWFQASANSMIFQGLSLNSSFWDKWEAETFYVAHCHPRCLPVLLGRWADPGAIPITSLLFKALKAVILSHYRSAWQACLQSVSSCCVHSPYPPTKHPSSLLSITTPLPDAYFMLQRLWHYCTYDFVMFLHLNSFWSPRIQLCPPILSLIMFLKVMFLRPLNVFLQAVVFIKRLKIIV